MPLEGGAISAGWLNGVLASSAEWRHGPLHGLVATRIGVEYGFAGRVHRITGTTNDGEPATLVLKEEDRAAVERALVFRRHHADSMGGSIPRLYGSRVDSARPLGVLLMEDIAPGTQGDVLVGCSRAQAESLVDVLARLHAHVPHTADLPRWRPRPIDNERWNDTFTRARGRYPGILTSELTGRLVHLPHAVDRALAALGDGPACWIHADMHLDNVRFRLDDSAVILDWANAAIGPPALDIAHLLTEGLDTGRPEAGLGEWLPFYAEAAARRGAAVDVDELRSSIGWAIWCLLSGAVEWAGRTAELPPRLLDVRENLLRNAVAWLGTDVVPQVI